MMKRTSDLKPQYEHYERMLAQWAWKFCHRTGADFEEAMSTANLAFFEAQRTYDPEKASFSTHLYWSLKGCFLKELLTSGRQEMSLQQEDGWEPEDILPEKRLEFIEWFHSLPPSTYRVGKACLENSCDVLFAPNGRGYRKRVLHRLIGTYSWRQIEEGMRGMKVALQQLSL